MLERSAILSLELALKDKDSRAAFATADSLIALEDSSGYDLYYDVLTGERKIDEKLITEKKRLIAEPTQRNFLALGVAAGFVPYAGYAWIAWKEMSADYMSPVRVRALKRLALDPDPRIGQGLVRTTFDRHEKVRASALAANARHGNHSLACQIIPHLADKKASVRYAAAAILRLSVPAAVDWPVPSLPAPVTP